MNETIASLIDDVVSCAEEVGVQSEYGDEKYQLSAAADLAKARAALDAKIDELLQKRVAE